jgi:predicted TIM-barrel fold metal-dependent hydrolase
MIPFLEEVSKFGLTVFIHVMAESTMESPWGLEKLALRFPKLTFIALDAFSGLTQTFYLEGIAQRCPNIILETGMAFSMGRIPERFATTLGPERVMYGSDLYTFAASQERPAVLGEILGSEALSEQGKRDIVWGNAERLFPALKKLR